MDFLNPATWAKPRGYSNGVAAEGRQIFVAGQVGWNAAGVFESDDFAVQARQALHNVAAVLAAGGAQPSHIVRLTWYVLDKREYLAALREIGAAYREAIGAHFPAMTLIQVSGLVEDRARLEIEATAVVPHA